MQPGSNLLRTNILERVPTSLKQFGGYLTKGNKSGKGWGKRLWWQGGNNKRIITCHPSETELTKVLDQINLGRLNPLFIGVNDACTNGGHFGFQIILNPKEEHYFQCNTEPGRDYWIMHLRNLVDPVNYSLENQEQQLKEKKKAKPKKPPTASPAKAKKANVDKDMAIKLKTLKTFVKETIQKDLLPKTKALRAQGVKNKPSPEILRPLVATIKAARAELSTVPAELKPTVPKKKEGSDQKTVLTNAFAEIEAALEDLSKWAQTKDGKKERVATVVKVVKALVTIYSQHGNN